MQRKLALLLLIVLVLALPIAVSQRHIHAEFDLELCPKYEFNGNLWPTFMSTGEVMRSGNCEIWRGELHAEQQPSITQKLVHYQNAHVFEAGFPSGILVVDNCGADGGITRCDVASYTRLDGNAEPAYILQPDTLPGEEPFFAPHRWIYLPGINGVQVPVPIWDLEAGSYAFYLDRILVELVEN